MTTDELPIWALESELRAAGYYCARVGATLPFPALALEFCAQTPELRPFDEGFAVAVTFEARAPGHASDGIRVLQVGYGETAEAAAQDAARQWVLGVFPALRSYIARPEHICEVETARMLVRTVDGGEQYAWTVHMPPIIYRVWGDCDFAPEMKATDVLHAVFDVVHGCAAHNHLFWLECFAVRYPDGEVDATCRYNNEDWPDGRDALLVWTTGWPDSESCLFSKRQFLLFEPTPVDQ